MSNHKYPKLLGRSGVYALKNKSTGRAYIGSSGNLYARRAHHFNILRYGQHPNRNIQREYNEDGADFEFVVLEYCEPSRLIELENHFMNEYRAHTSLLNLGKTACAGSFEWTDEMKAVLKEKRKNRPPATTETKLKISKSLSGKPFSEERKSKHAEARRNSKSVSAWLESLKRPVIQLEKNLEFVKEWGSVSEAARIIGQRPSNLSLCASGKRSSYCGFKWKYKSKQ